MAAAAAISPWIPVGTSDAGVKGEKCGPEYATEAEVQQAFKPGTHIGYYQAHSKYVLLKSARFGSRIWKPGSPNGTVTAAARYDPAGAAALAKEEAQKARAAEAVAAAQVVVIAEPAPSPAPSPALVKPQESAAEEGVPPRAVEDQTTYATVLLAHGLKIGTVENAEKESPQYATEEECRANLGPKHVGYYVAGGMFMRLKASTFGRDWAVGKPNGTVTKVIARAEKRQSKLETGLKVAAGVAAVGAVAVAVVVTAGAKADLADAEQQANMNEQEKLVAEEARAAAEQQANMNEQEKLVAEEARAAAEQRVSKSEQEKLAVEEARAVDRAQHEVDQRDAAAAVADAQMREMRMTEIAVERTAEAQELASIAVDCLAIARQPEPQPQPQPAPAPVYITSYSSSSQATYNDFSGGYGKKSIVFLRGLDFCGEDKLTQGWRGVQGACRV